MIKKIMQILCLTSLWYASSAGAYEHAFDHCVLVGTFTISSEQPLPDIQIQAIGADGIVWNSTETTESEANTINLKIYSRIHYTNPHFFYMHSVVNGFDILFDGINIVHTKKIDLDEDQACSKGWLGCKSNKTAQYLLDKLQNNMTIADLTSPATKLIVDFSYTLNHDIDSQTQNASFCH